MPEADVTCPLCEAVRNHPLVTLDTDPRPEWVLINTRAFKTPMLVATDHDMEFDFRNHGDCTKVLEVAKALLAYTPVTLITLMCMERRVYLLNVSKGSASAMFNHTRVHFKLITPPEAMPQTLADNLAMEAQAACKWFWDHNILYPAVLTNEPIYNDDVPRRIQGMQYAMDREVARIHSFSYEGGWIWRFDEDWRERHTAWVKNWKAYVATNGEPARNRRLDLNELPFGIQRALVTRWQKLWEDWESTTTDSEEQ